MEDELRTQLKKEKERSRRLWEALNRADLDKVANSFYGWCNDKASVYNNRALQSERDYGWWCLENNLYYRKDVSAREFIRHICGRQEDYKRRRDIEYADDCRKLFGF